MPWTRQYPSSPFERYECVVSHQSRIVASADGWQMMYRPPGAMVAPAGKPFQNSKSPGVAGLLLTLGKPYSSRLISWSVGLKISRYLLFDEPSAA